jgi:hypothetical protein
MDDGFGGPFQEIYDGRDNTQTLDYEVFDLVAERFYRFRVYAIDVNGPGQYSNEISLQACVPPSELERPTIEWILETSFLMTW